MSIYQAPRKRWRAALVSGVVGALIGLGIGVALGSRDVDPLDALRQLDATLEQAAAPLEVLVIHGEAETGSAADARVVTDAVARTTERFDEVRDAVAAMNPDAVDDFDEHVEALRALAREDGDPEDVADEADELADLLRGIVRT